MTPAEQAEQVRCFAYNKDNGNCAVLDIDKPTAEYCMACRFRKPIREKTRRAWYPFRDPDEPKRTKCKRRRRTADSPADGGDRRALCSTCLYAHHRSSAYVCCGYMCTTLKRRPSSSWRECVEMGVYQSFEHYTAQEWQGHFLTPKAGEDLGWEDDGGDEQYNPMTDPDVLRAIRDRERDEEI